jgi:hypothetical protein
VNFRKRILAIALVTFLTAVPAALGQDAPDDRVIRPAQPDYTLVSLPTGMRVPRHRSAFRVTHRFTRPLGEGDFGDLLGDAFGLDRSALIGLEYRFGLFRGVQVGVHRTNLNKTIEFFTQYDLFQQRADMPVGLAVWGSIDGTDNFSDSYSPAVGAIVSRLVGERAAFYLQPVWVNNSNPDPSEIVNDNDTFMLGLSTRIRVRPTVYVVGEWAPRLAGHDPGIHHGSFAIEKRMGGHVFQLNFSNAFGTTMGQIARGGLSNDDWYLGFNISRRFN